MKLTFSRGNAKLDALEKAPFARGGQVWTFSVLSGWTCPYAKECLSKAVEVDGKRHIEDGPYTQYRCFSASQEALFPAVYNSRKANGQLIALAAKSVQDAAAAILAELKKRKKLSVVRIHVGGDFQTKNYMLAWILAAIERPDVTFYAYTKSLPFWLALQSTMPSNFVLTASYGGWKDELIAKHGLRYAKVVYSIDEAEALGLEIDHDDSHAADPAKRGESFALLLHGTQPKGSKAAEALRNLDGVGTYGRGKKGRKKSG